MINILIKTKEETISFFINNKKQLLFTHKMNHVCSSQTNISIISKCILICEYHPFHCWKILTGKIISNNNLSLPTGSVAKW